jgi:putative DNA primase/helicase
VMHGPQGTGKNLFFEAVLGCYGRYGRLLNQDSVEDKFNDWASCLLFGVADEMVARDEMYHAKNKLKTLITSDRIRINPKNLASHYERNHANLVFLSNEIQPMALERDDRRYAVIWTPAKLDAGFYNAVLGEIRDGGIPALHDYLLSLDLADFGPATLPPMTTAKRDLIELGMESTERFYVDWTSKYLPLPVVSVRTEDLYEAYRHWAHRNGVAKLAQMATFIGSISKRPGVRKARERHYEGYSHQKIVQSTCIHPPGVQPPGAADMLASSINAFNEAAKAWRDAAAASSSRPTGFASYNRTGTDHDAAF